MLAVHFGKTVTIKVKKCKLTEIIHFEKIEREQVFKKLNKCFGQGKKKSGEKFTGESIVSCKLFPL
jgi:hypothetical protein